MNEFVLAICIVNLLAIFFYWEGGAGGRAGTAYIIALQNLIGATNNAVILNFEYGNFVIQVIMAIVVDN